MGKQREQRLRNSCKQIAWIVLGFIFCISLLEAKGFVVWAKRLEAGSLQQNVLRLTETVDIVWSAVAGPITQLRPNALRFLNQHGWSDMPAQAIVEEGEMQGSTAVQTEPELSLILDKPTDGVAGGVNDPGETGGAGIGNSGAVETRGDGEPGGGQDGAIASGASALVSGVAQPVDGKLVALPVLEPGQVRHIALAGDSMMAVGLAPQLQRDLVPFRQMATTVKAYRSATGLARPDVFNWQKEYPLMVAAQKPDVVIVAIGANDTQNMQVGRQVLTIGSDEWKMAYEGLLVQYIEMLTGDGAVVLWIKLPPMRPNKYNTNINTVNEVAQRVVSRYPQVIWWDVSERFLNSEGKFMEMASLAPGQRQVRIRQADGIHLTDQGAMLLTTEIVEWLNLSRPVEEAPELLIEVEDGEVEQVEVQP